MRVTFSEITASLPKTKNSKSSWWVKLWVRKASFFFTYLCMNLGLSSNMVSYLSVLTSVAAFICLCVPAKGAQIAGVVLINLWLVLDCVDGNIARCMKQKKKYGEFIDAMSGYVTVGFIYIGIGAAVYQSGGLFVQPGNMLALILGAVASVSDILARLIYLNFCSVEIPEGKNAEKAKQEDKHTLNYLRKRVGKELGISGMFMPAMIIAVIWNCFDIVLAFYLAFNLFALLSTIVIYAYKAERYDTKGR